MKPKTMDLVVVKPSGQKKVYGVLSHNLTAIEPPLWPALLAAFVREKGYQVEIIDAEAENLSPKETAERIVKEKPRLVMFTVVGNNLSASTPNMAAARTAIQALKSRFPRIKTLLWGLHPSALPERTLKEEGVNFVCEGEGFFTITELLKNLKSRKKMGRYKIPGLWYRQGKQIRSNAKAPLFKNLDDLPLVAWDLLPMDKYRAHNWHCFANLDRRQPYGVVYTSLGCPYNCSFCALKALTGAPGVRFRSPEKVIEDIDLLVKNYGVRNIKILDECFVLNKDHVAKICDLIISRGYDLNIWAYARVDTVDKKLLKKMKKAGINWLGLGYESGSQKIRNVVSKGRFDNKMMKRVTQMIYDAGIHIGGNFIFGLPEDDLKTMTETLALAKELNCEYTNFYVTMAYPGSRLYREAQEQGVKLPDNWLGYSQFSYETFPLPTEYLSNAEVLRFRDQAFNEFYRSKKYLSMIRKKFGQKAVDHIKEMSKTRLKRRLLGN